MNARMSGLTDRLVEVAKELADQGVDQTEIGRRVGVSKSAVSKWLDGTVKNLKLDNLYALEEAFGYSAHWLATGHGPKHIDEVRQQAAAYVIAKKVEAGELLDISNLPEKAKGLLQATLRAFDDSTDCAPAPVKSAGE